MKTVIIVRWHFDRAVDLEIILGMGKKQQQTVLRLPVLHKFSQGTSKSNGDKESDATYQLFTSVMSRSASIIDQSRDHEHAKEALSTSQALINVPEITGTE